jgi:hypothetical protein
MPAAARVADTSSPLVAEGKPPDAVRTAPELSAPDFQPLTREQFIKASIENRRARAAEAYAEAKVRVARYLETGDFADLFPEQ